MPLIGEGSYGCVFDPPMPCIESRKTRRKNTVGKVFISEEEFESERKITKIVKDVDPNSKFTIPLYNSCRVKDLDKDETYKKCELFRHFHGDIKALYQLVYKNGGINIKDLMRRTKGTIPRFKKIMRSMCNVVHGIKSLIDAGYVHQDIKPANILWQAKSNQILLIDFGIMIKANEVYKDKNKFVLRYDYPYFPPEYKRYDTINNYNIFYNKVMANYNNSIHLEVIRNLGIPIKQQLQDAFVLSETKYQQPNKIDIFSLGIVFLELYLWAKVYKNKKLSQAFKPLLLGMICFNVEERFNIDQVIKLMKLFD